MRSEVAPLALWLLCRDPQLHCCSRDPNGIIRSFVRREPSKKGQVGSRLVRGMKQAARQPMVHRATPVRVGRRGALVVRDRYEACALKLPNHLADAGKVKTAMQSRQKRGGGSRQNRQVGPIEMSMDHVELLCASGDSVEH